MLGGLLLKVEFKDNHCFCGVKDILIRDGIKLLKIFYGGNGDLYFDIFGSRYKDENGLNIGTFTIKQTEEIYPYFEQLINHIIDCKVFDISEIELALCDDDHVADEIAAVQKMNEKLKEKEAYKKLVSNDAIVWYSDNIYDEKANVLRIEKEYEKIKLTFIDNPEDPAFGFGIRIDNSHSKYDPFHLCFMSLFNQFQLLAKNDSNKKLVKIAKN